MDSCFHAVIHFQVQLRQLVFAVGAGLLDISQGTGVDNVSYNETLDGLVLWNGLACANTANTLDVAAAMLIAPVVASFDRHYFCSQTPSSFRLVLPRVWLLRQETTKMG